MIVDVDSESLQPLAALAKLVAALDEKEIGYCHWKSNSHLADAVKGRTDLDLLVERTAAGEFRQLLDEFGFKPLVAAPGKHYPGVENYLGFDSQSGRLIHLHIHYQLVLGQQFVKDYRLPIEDWLLASTRRLGGVSVPTAEAELIILSIRATLKYRLRDALKDIAGFRRPGVPRQISAEIGWLADQTDRESVVKALEEVGDVLPTDLVRDLCELHMEPSRHGFKLLLLRQRLRDALRSYLRVSRTKSTILYWKALSRKRLQSGRMKRRMTPRSGGLLVGIVGADGAGKSTVVATLHDWLGWRLDVRSVYMGTASPGFAGRVLKVVSKTARGVNRRVTAVAGDQGLLSVTTGWLNQVLLGLRRVEQARRRYTRYRSARAAAARGTVVLFDRFPLPSLPVLGWSMDGPRLEQELTGSRSALMTRLAVKERRIFARISPPEFVIALEVSPEVSLGRKPDHDAESIEAKAVAVSGIRGTETTAVVDADQPLEEVVTRSKALLWGWL